MEAAVRKRTRHVRGRDSYEIGFTTGRSLGERLGTNVERYLVERTGSDLEARSFGSEALAWAVDLPSRFANEIRGIAEGSRIHPERIAEWAYVEAYLQKPGCSSFLRRQEGCIWLGHNNDTYVPDLWGYATIKEIDGRIPTMTFGLEGDVWSTAGINQARLWLHVDHLPVADAPDTTKVCLPTYGFLVEAVETCENLDDVGNLLGKIDRNDGMLLMAVDGKTNEGAVFECTCSSAIRCDLDSDWLVRTNHALETGDAWSEPQARRFSTWARADRVSTLLNDASGRALSHADLVGFLADDDVERRDREFATAHSIVACPGSAEIWYTFGGRPSASRGSWSSVPWPW